MTYIEGSQAPVGSPRLLVVGTTILGSTAGPALESIYIRAFKRLGLERVDMFDNRRFKRYIVGSSLPVRAVNRMIGARAAVKIQQEFQELLHKRRGEYDAIIIFKGMEFPRQVLDACRLDQPQAVWININPDDPLNIETRGSTNQNVIDSLSFFDLYFIWSQQLQALLAQRGCRRVEYLPFGYDPDLHAPAPNAALVPGRVSFVGHWDREREATLSQLAQYDLQIAGQHWDRLAKDSPLQGKRIVSAMIYGQQLARMITEAAVSLNLLRGQNLAAHNMRTFEIPAMDGLMLTSRSDEQNRFFPEDEACLMFADLDELKRKLDWVLANPLEAQQIRQRGVELVPKHSYTERARQVLALISAVKSADPVSSDMDR